MPLYEFACTACKSKKTIFRLVEERDKETSCACGEPMYRTLKTGGFSLKGGGWYKDGYSK